MTKINLLPWRERLQEEQRRQFWGILLAAAILVSSFVGIYYFTLTNKVKRVLRVSQYIEEETRLLDQQLAEIQEIKEQREELLIRRLLLEKLQLERISVVHILEQISKKMPDGVYLTEIKKQGPLLTLRGKAESNTRVADLMQRIEESAWVSDPLLTEIKADDADNEQIRSFEINLRQNLPLLSIKQQEGYNGSE